jgi:hypothetical protein
MSGNEIALTSIIVIAVFSILFALVMSWNKSSREEP